RLELARGQIEAMHAGEAVVLRPDLAVNAGIQWARHVDLRVVLVDLERQVPRLELLGLAIELRDRALVHHAEPEVAVPVEAHGEGAGREARLELRHRELGDLARARVELAQRLLAEVRVPGDTVSVHDDVVRLDGRPRQVVLGDDDARSASRRAGQRLQRVLPARRRALIWRRAQIDGG